MSINCKFQVFFLYQLKAEILIYNFTNTVNFRHKLLNIKYSPYSLSIVYWGAWVTMQQIMCMEISQQFVSKSYAICLYIHNDNSVTSDCLITQYIAGLQWNAFASTLVPCILFFKSYLKIRYCFILNVIILFFNCYMLPISPFVLLCS